MNNNETPIQLKVGKADKTEEIMTRGNREFKHRIKRILFSWFLSVGMAVAPSIAFTQNVQAEDILIGLNPGAETQQPSDAGSQPSGMASQPAAAGGITSAAGSTQSSAGSTASDAGTAQSGTGSAQSGTGSAQPEAAGTAEEESWSLILVNKNHPIPPDYKMELTQLSGGNAVDSRIYPQLQRMFDDARAQGIYPHITSSYRSQEKQQELMDQKIQEYEAGGYGHEEAVKLAEEWVAIPGTSEHQLGLCADISSDPASGQDAGSVWYWLKMYSADYGFVQRYPENKTDITGIINEPWHYRYVGVHAAKIMNEENLCLEEYLQKYKAP